MKIIDNLDGNIATRSESVIGTNHRITSVSTLGYDKQPITRGNENDAAYYVFRFGDNEGFAIMAADNRLPELLAVAAGTPNQDNPSADLPDPSFWTPPVIPSDTATAIDPPILDQEDDDPNYVKILSVNPIKVHWGKGKPFNKKLIIEPNRDYELRMPSAGVAIAQLMTISGYDQSTTYRDKDSLYGYINKPIDLKKLSYFHYGSDFSKNSEMATQVAGLYKLIGLDSYMFSFHGTPKTDSVTGEKYIEGTVLVSCGNSSAETTEDTGIPSNDMFFYGLGQKGFRIADCPYFTSYQFSTLQDFFQNGYMCLRLDSPLDDEPQRCYIVHNMMYRFDDISVRYFLVNKCNDGNGDGYYLASGLDANHYSISVQYQKLNKN